MRENKITNKELEKIHSQVRFPVRPLIPRQRIPGHFCPRFRQRPYTVRMNQLELESRGIKTTQSYDFNVILIWTELIFA